MSRKKSSRTWVRQHIQDPYVRQAQQKGYRARAAFKLAEILDRFHLLRRGATVVDLGASPGSWAQLLRERLLDAHGQLQGRILALDILPMEAIPGVSFIQGDFRETETLRQLEELLQKQPADLVLSDMAPNLSGVAAADAARMQHVCELALDFAREHLKPGGALVMKAFQGSGFSQIVEACKQQFGQVQVFKPKASRDSSAETYLVCRGSKRSRA